MKHGLAPHFAAGTRKACADNRKSIEAVRGSKAAHLLPATRHAMREVAGQAEHVLEDLERLPATGTAMCNLAARTLERAAALLEAVSNSPEDIAGMPWVAEALQHVGEARALVREVRRASEIQSERASAPRPGRRPPIAARIAGAMQPYRRDNVTFKVFVRAWEGDVIDGLRLSAVDEQSYVIADENADARPAPYTRGSLEKMYSRGVLARPKIYR